MPLVLLILAFAGLLFVNIHFQSRVLPGIYVFGTNVSGKSYDQLKTFVDEKAIAYKRQKVIFEVKGDDSGTVAVSPEDLGESFDSEQTANDAFYIGKSGDFGRDLLVRISSFFVKRDAVARWNIDFPGFLSTVGEITKNQTHAARNATIVFEPGPKVVSEEEGLVVDMTKLLSDFRDHLQSLSADPIKIEFIKEAPQVKAENAADALEKVKLLNNQRIVLVFGFDSWKLSGRNLLNVLSFYPKGAQDGVSTIELASSNVQFKNLQFSNLSKATLEVGVNEDAISQFVSTISKSVNQQKVDATLVFDGSRVKQFTPARDGQKLDEQTTFNLIKSSVSTDNLSAEKDLTINLPVKVVPALIANDEINSLGIKELVGRGVSYFAGSIPNRAFNVGLGSNRINGTIVKSGETFSFNKTVGEVSGASGYKQAYVISAGRTVLDDGGGICQVSTTVFRAALAAGLPIVSRTAHAYRVGYYEQGGFKAGLDATVFAPSVDFVFKNDTDHSILVQTLVDPAQARLEVDIYGTRDGRKVELTDPVVTNFVPAPPDKFQDDPTLPKGTKKQVDFSAQGATSVFKRKVLKGDKVLIDETYRSVYRPWQAVFMVGTAG